jgi:hypothetical protein
MSYEAGLFVVMAGTGALALLTFLIETLLLEEIRPWLTCLQVGVGLLFTFVLMGHEWIISHTGEWYAWEIISNGEPWQTAIPRLVLTFFSTLGPILLIWNSSQMRADERRDQDMIKRLSDPRTVREQWN